jgi:hypothetical protein
VTNKANKGMRYFFFMAAIVTDVQRVDALEDG